MKVSIIARPRRGLCAVLLLCAAASLGGCFGDGTIRRLARTGVEGAAQGLSPSQEELRRALRDILLKDDILERIAGKLVQGVVGQVTEAGQQARVAALTAALMDILREHADEALTHALQTAGGQMELTLQRISADSLARADATIKGLLHKDLVEVTEEITRRNAEVLAKSIADQLRGPLGQSLQESSGVLARSLVNEAAGSLRSEANQQAVQEFLRSAMSHAVLGVGDGLRQELHSSPAQTALTAGVVALGTLLLLLGGVLWYFVREYRLSAKALTIVAQKINEGAVDAKQLKQAIHESTRRNNVEQWMSDFLKRRGL